MGETAGRSLEGLLRIRMHEDGPMPFDRFMETALYHPGLGYYASGAATRAGPHGDFVTAPTLTPLYGAALARFVAAAWERLGRPASWCLWDVGCGTGALAAPLVSALQEQHPAAAHGMHMALVDASPIHRSAAAQRMKGLLPAGRLLVDEALPDPLGRPVVVVANELLDNLPVGVLVRRGDQWRERRVGVGKGGRFAWVEQAAPSDWARWADGFEVRVPDGQQVEVPVGIAKWLDAVTSGVADAPSVLVLIDYGETARDLFGEPRPGGTLMTFMRQGQDADILADVGARDITAHVNWTSVAKEGSVRGWDHLGYVTQGMFLMDLGLMETAAELGSEVRGEADMAALQAVKEILLPGGMGERFKVLGLVRGVATGGDAWPGFKDRRPVAPVARRA